MRPFDGAVDRLEIIGVGDMLDEPAVRLESRRDILAKRQRGLALDGDLVVVVKPQQLVQAEVRGERSGLRTNALHHVAVTADGVRAVIDNFMAVTVESFGEPAFGDGHADGIGE